MTCQDMGENTQKKILDVYSTAQKKKWNGHSKLLFVGQYVLNIFTPHYEKRFPTASL